MIIGRLRTILSVKMRVTQLAMLLIVATMLVACGDDNGSSATDEGGGCSSSVIPGSDRESSSSSNVILSGSEESSSSVVGSCSSELGESGLEAISAMAYYCVHDSVKVDSLLAIYKADGNFGDMTTSFADCAYEMSFDYLDDDVIMPSPLKMFYLNEKPYSNFKISWVKFRETIYKFWQDDFGVGPCNRDFENVVKRNQDSLSESPRYFICTDRRPGYYSEINWVSASALQVATYGLECDSSDYRSITDSADGSMYVCDRGDWRLPKDVEKEYGLCKAENDGEVKAGEIYEYICDSASWKLNELVLVDSSDNREFRALKIAGLYWMSENFKTDSSRYFWNEVMDENFCPKGWRIPSDKEWESMLDTLRGVRANEYPMNLVERFGGVVNWWSSTEYGADSAVVFGIDYHPMDYASSRKFTYHRGIQPKESKYRYDYARCVKDGPIQ